MLAELSLREQVSVALLKCVRVCERVSQPARNLCCRRFDWYRMSGDSAPADFDENMQTFYVALAELQWDRAVVSLLNMQAIVEAQETAEANQAAHNDATGGALECRKEILQACWAKVKAVALQQLQKFIDEDSPANAVVIWEKTKVLGFAEDASELYRNAFCGMVQNTAVNVMNRLQSTRALAGVAQVRSTLSNSLGDSEQSRKKYVAAVSELLNEGFAKVSAILAYGLRDDIDVSIALSVNDKIVRRHPSNPKPKEKIWSRFEESVE